MKDADMTEIHSSESTCGSLGGQTFVVIGGSSGIGLETAHQAGRAGAEVILTGRDCERLERAAAEGGAARTATVNLSDMAGLQSFFDSLPAQVDHVLVTGGGPAYGTIADLDLGRAHRVLDEQLLGSLRVARGT